MIIEDLTKIFMRRLYTILFVWLAIACLGSCYDDKGEYDYDWVSRAQVSDFAKAYTYTMGDTMRLSPKIWFSKMVDGVNTYDDSTDIFSNDEYAYLWITKRYDKTMGYIASDTIGRERSLNYVVALAPEQYFVEFKICNLSRNLEWSSHFVLNVTLSAPEGWLLLEDNEGVAELSIYVRKGDGSMQLVTDVLARSGIPAASLRGPRQVFATYQNQVGNGVWILTDHFTGYLDVKSGHKWTARQTVQNHLVESVDQNFAFTKIMNLMYYTVFGFSEDGLRVSRYPGMLYTGDLLPKGTKRFELSPYLATIGFEMMTKQILGFNQTQKCFTLLNLTGNFDWSEADTKFPKGYDLKLMEVVGESGSQKIYCLLTKPDGVYQLIASSATQVESEAKLISTSEKFLNAEQCVYHKKSQLPYYLYEGKLYVNRVAGDDREVEYFKVVEKEEEDEGGNEEEDVPDEEEVVEKVPAVLEGRINYITGLVFSDVFLEGYEYRQVFMNYLVVATELPDGSGMVYFLTPEQANAQLLTISDSIKTKHKVLSIDYQRPGI